MLHCLMSYDLKQLLNFFIPFLKCFGIITQDQRRSSIDGTVTPECKKELIGRHVINNLQIDIASGATSEQADITFLCLVTILDHQMTGKINPHSREWLHPIKAKVRLRG